MDAKKLLTATQKAIQRAAVISDETKGFAAIDDGFEALSKLVAYVKHFDIEGASYCPECGRKGVSFEAAGKTASYLAKIVNDTVRLMEYARGNADQRSETSTGMSDLVKSLTSEQLKTVLGWMDENKGDELTIQ